MKTANRRLSKIRSHSSCLGLSSIFVCRIARMSSSELSQGCWSRYFRSRMNFYTSKIKLLSVSWRGGPKWNKTKCWKSSTSGRLNSSRSNRTNSWLQQIKKAACASQQSTVKFLTSKNTINRCKDTSAASATVNMTADNRSIPRSSKDSTTHKH